MPANDDASSKSKVASSKGVPTIDGCDLSVFGRQAYHADPWKLRDGAGLDLASWSPETGWIPLWMDKLWSSFVGPEARKRIVADILIGHFKRSVRAVHPVASTWSRKGALWVVMAMDGPVRPAGTVMFDTPFAAWYAAALAVKQESE